MILNCNYMIIYNRNNKIINNYCMMYSTAHCSIQGVSNLFEERNFNFIHYYSHF